MLLLAPALERSASGIITRLEHTYAVREELELSPTRYANAIVSTIDLNLDTYGYKLSVMAEMYGFTVKKFPTLARYGRTFCHLVLLGASRAKAFASMQLRSCRRTRKK